MFQYLGIRLRWRGLEFESFLFPLFFRHFPLVAQKHTKTSQVLRLGGKKVLLCFSRNFCRVLRNEFYLFLSQLQRPSRDMGDSNPVKTKENWYCMNVIFLFLQKVLRLDRKSSFRPNLPKYQPLRICHGIMAPSEEFCKDSLGQ